MHLALSLSVALYGAAGALAVALAALFVSLVGLQRARRADAALQALDLDVPQLTAMVEELGLFRLGLRHAVQGVGLVRFDAFPGSGGHFSFALALVDAEANGVVLTALSGREETRIYAKRLTQGRCDQALSPEESQAVQEARAQLPHPAGTEPPGWRPPGP